MRISLSLEEAGQVHNLLEFVAMCNRVARRKDIRTTKLKDLMEGVERSWPGLYTEKQKLYIRDHACAYLDPLDL